MQIDLSSMTSTNPKKNLWTAGGQVLSRNSNSTIIAETTKASVGPAERPQILLIEQDDEILNAVLALWIGPDRAKFDGVL